MKINLQVNADFDLDGNMYGKLAAWWKWLLDMKYFSEIPENC